MSIQILAFSSSRSGNSGYLETNIPFIKNFIGSRQTNIAFIPFAIANKDYDEYGYRVINELKKMPYKIDIIKPENAKEAIQKSDAVMVGGGNTFKLLHDIYDLNLMELIRNKVESGAPYIGWSAGSNIIGKTIGTTNDMPIIQPASFQALHFLPFQINPHYNNVKAPGFNGETRDERLEEFLQMNPEIPVVALPEGSALEMKNNILKYFGDSRGVLFHSDKEGLIIKNPLIHDQDISFLL